jgi:hypothetical protein
MLRLKKQLGSTLLKPWAVLLEQWATGLLIPTGLNAKNVRQAAGADVQKNCTLDTPSGNK